jgi:hypothetical protein
LNTLRLENERDLIEVNRNTISDLNQLVTDLTNLGLYEDDKVNELNEEFMSEIVEIFK